MSFPVRRIVVQTIRVRSGFSRNSPSNENDGRFGGGNDGSREGRVGPEKKMALDASLEVFEVVVAALWKDGGEGTTDETKHRE